MPKKSNSEPKRKQKSRQTRHGLKPARFLDPKSDLVFKRIFGEYPELIISFLNGILPLPEGGLIASITYLPTEQTPRIPTMKNTIVDVKCTDQQGRIFIVEMQLNWTTHFMKRLLFGASKAYVEQLKIGEDYHALCPVYGLSIINDVFDHKTAEWYHHYRTVNVKDSSKIFPGLELIFLELPKFKPETQEHRRMGVLWLRFLREINEEAVEVPEDFTNNPLLSKALEVAQESSYSKAELEAYDLFWDAVRNEKAILRSLQEAQCEAQKAKDEALKAESKAQEAESKAQEAESKAQEAESKAQEAESKAQEAESKAQEAESKAQEAESKAQEAESKAQEAESKAQEAERAALKAKENQLDTAKALLLDGFDASKVAKLTKLPLETIIKLASQTS